MIINRYREATAALGYNGDSVLNSLSDIAMMGLGFLLARKFPLWVSIAVVLVLELVPLFVIRDNLTLNVLDSACAECRHQGMAGAARCTNPFAKALSVP